MIDVDMQALDLLNTLEQQQNLREIFPANKN